MPYKAPTKGDFLKAAIIFKRAGKPTKESLDLLAPQALAAVVTIYQAEGQGLVTPKDDVTSMLLDTEHKAATEILIQGGMSRVAIRGVLRSVYHDPAEWEIG